MFYYFNRFFVISTEEKSSQVTPQRKFKLCRASYGDFSSVEMTNVTKKNFATLRLCEIFLPQRHKIFHADFADSSRFKMIFKNNLRASA